MKRKCCLLLDNLMNRFQKVSLNRDLRLVKASLNLSNIYLMCFFLNLPRGHSYKLSLCMGISDEIEEATIIVIPIKFGISNLMMAKKSAKKCAFRVFVSFLIF